MCDRADQASAMAVVLESMHLFDISTWRLNWRQYGLHGTVDLGKVTIWNHLRWLEADANLEASRAPVDELDRPLRLERGDGGVDILWHDISTVEHASGHVLSVARITLDHLVVRLEAGHADLLDRVRFVGGFGRGDDRCVGDKREMDARVRHKVGLELVEVDIERAVET